MRALRAIGPDFPSPESKAITLIFVPDDKSMCTRFACSPADKRRLLSTFFHREGRWIATWQGKWTSHAFDVSGEVLLEWRLALGSPSSPVPPEQFPPYDWGAR